MVRPKDAFPGTRVGQKDACGLRRVFAVFNAKVRHQDIVSRAENVEITRSGGAIAHGARAVKGDVVAIGHPKHRG
jgi:hypothetical protein